MNSHVGDPWAKEPPSISSAHTEGDASDAIQRALEPVASQEFVPVQADGSPIWRFKLAQKGDDYDDPTEGEFFAEESLQSALVRESIQNALDAEIDPEVPVCIRYSLGETAVGDLPASLFDGLRDHVDSSDVTSWPEVDTCKWLLIEDFNTVGLSGDPYDDPVGDEDLSNHYFYFWRNTGRTDKKSDERGSWGIGKAVFQSASKTRTFFGLTVRHDDGAKLLRGKSVLSTHFIGDDRFMPRGHFGEFSKTPGEENFALPIVESGLLDEVSETFGAKRGDRSGLSVLVPWLDEEVDGEWTADRLALAVCEQYFLPIVAGQLIVEIERAGRVLSIDRESIETVVKSEIEVGDAGQIAELMEQIHFAEWATTVSRDEYICLPEPALEKGTNWSTIQLPPDRIEELRESFDEGKRLAFRCGCGVFPQDADPEVAWFSVFMERDDSLVAPHVTYVRRGITIPKVSSGAPPGVRALVSINWPMLGKLLGDVENPSHTRWEPRKARANLRWIRKETSIQFVERSVKEILGQLRSDEDEVDISAFSELFSFERHLEQTKKRKKKRKGTGGGDVEVPKTEPAFSVSKISGGVVVRGEKGLAADDRLRLRLAYERRSGDAFGKWDARDFQVEDLDASIQSGEFETRDGQVLIARVDDPADFELEIVGFDLHRDLRVDVRKVVESS